MTNRYGVEILSVNIISAKPAHSELMQSLAKGAVAAAEAQQLRITAMGRAKAAKIMAQGEADVVTRAEACVRRLKSSRRRPWLCSRDSSTGEAMAKAGSSLILGHSP